MSTVHDPLLGFDPMAQDPSRNTGGSKGLPPSDSKGHLVVITGHEMKQLSTKENGNRIEFSLLVVGEGPFKGKTGTHSENIGHVDEVPREIAASRVTAITSHFEWSLTIRMVMMQDRELRRTKVTLSVKKSLMLMVWNPMTRMQVSVEVALQLA